MIKIKEILVFILIAIPYSCLLIGAWNGDYQLYPVIKRIRLSNESGQFKIEVQHYISRGSSITKAQKIMELNGFECRFIENDINYYQARRLDIDRTIKSPHERVDYLYCLLINSGTRWETYIEYKDRKVTDIYASKG